MADLRMLTKLQQIRQMVWDMQIHKIEAKHETLRQIEELCNEAIDLDAHMGLETVGAE